MSTCTLQGTLIDAGGQPMAAVGVRVSPVTVGGAPVFTAHGELVGLEPLATITDENGYFAINLVRGLQCVVTIDVLGYARKVTIPDQPTCNLKDL